MLRAWPTRRFRNGSLGEWTRAVTLFADIADSTALTERLGDAAFRERARGLDSALRAVIREKGIEAALRCGNEGGHLGLPLHLGLHVGDVIREGNNVYDGAINISARISPRRVRTGRG